MNTRLRTFLTTLMPGLFELGLTVLVLAFLFWQARAFNKPEIVRGSGDRYQQALALTVPILPDAQGIGRVASICTSYGGLTGVEPACRSDDRNRITTVSREAIDPAVLNRWNRNTYPALSASLAAPLHAQQKAIADLEMRSAEARADQDATGKVVDWRAESRHYRDAYDMPESAETKSLTLDCVWNFLNQRQQILAQTADTQAEQALVLINLAALLDGDATRLVNSSFLNPDLSSLSWQVGKNKATPECVSRGEPLQVAQRATEIIAKARSSNVDAAKATAMQNLFPKAGFYFSAWAMLALLLLKAGRKVLHPVRFLPLVLLIWSVVGWLSHIHVEWFNDRARSTAWLKAHGVEWPGFFGAMAIVSLVLLVLVQFLPKSTHKANYDPTTIPEPTAQTLSSRIGFAGFVLFLGLGWWLILDLSATGHFKNRFHALYQQLYVFVTFVLISVLPLLRLGFARTTGIILGKLLMLAEGGGRRGIRSQLGWLLPLLLALLLLFVTGFVLRNQRQLTSEIFRLWLILGVSWFFFLRGESVFGLGRTGGWQTFRMMLPLLFVVVVPCVGYFVTDDKGPLLVTLYASAIFFGGALAFALDRSGSHPIWGSALAAAMTVAWVSVITWMLFKFGPLSDRVAARLESVGSPFLASNDQLGLVLWFQGAAPSSGYGFGHVPWCGDVAQASCRGVPRQIQSDYIHTALIGVYGEWLATLLVVMFAFWMVRLVNQHRKVTDGKPNFGKPNFAQQAFISWIAVCWVGFSLAQLAVTVAGNLAWLPLTGITYPFVSFGIWSLVVNVFFLSLAINLPGKAQGALK